MAAPGSMSREELEQFVVSIVENYSGSQSMRESVAALVGPDLARITQKADETLALVKEEFVKTQALTAELDDKIIRSGQEFERMRQHASYYDRQHTERNVSVQASITQAQAAVDETRSLQQATMIGLDGKIAALDAKANSIYTESVRQSQIKTEQVVHALNQELIVIKGDIIRVADAASASPSTGPDQAFGGGSRGQDLISPKECPVSKISDGISVGDFKHWCLTVENHLESHRTWKGASRILRAVLRHKTEIDREAFNGICDEINLDYSDGSYLKIASADWVYAEKVSRLFHFLFMKLPKGIAGKTRLKDQNGFELWRQLHKELDPAHPEEGRQIVTRMRELFTGPSASTEALWQKILAQDRLNDEHLDKTGKYASDTELANNTWFGMTAELAKEAARDSSGIDELASYKEVKKFVQDSREFDLLQT